MICTNCNYNNIDESKYCSNCGQPLSNDIRKYGNINLKNLFSDYANQVTRAAGIETPTELKLGDVFSNVFKKHTEEEAESLFIVGTSHTTPNIEHASDTWPKPWLFARIFLLVALTYLGLYLGFHEFNNINFLPGLIIVGSFMVPLSLLIFFWEMNTPQNISIYEVIKVLFIGGVVSLIFTVFLSEFFGQGSSFAIIIGIVEETAKVLPIIWLLKKQKYKYILNGLLIGAAVSAGFAAFESAGYALRIGLIYGPEAMYNNLFIRGLLAPGGHIVWAALSGAALCIVKGERKFESQMLKDFRFVRIFIIVVSMHAAWDMGFTPSIAGIPIHMIILTITSWIIAFAFISSGLKEISKFKNSTIQINLT